MIPIFQAPPFLRLLTDQATGFVACAVIVVWMLVASAVSATRAPWSNEAWSANPAVTLDDHGYLGTQILESQNIWLQGVDQHLYWMMPLHSLFQAAWYRVVGFGLIRQRLLSVAFGAVALGSWFVIILSLTGQRFLALLAVCLIGFERNFLAAAGNGRMDMMAASLGTAGIASYLLLRGSRPRNAILVSHSLTAASIWTHPCGLLFAALLLLLILYLDRQRLRPVDLGLALVPYVGAAGLWSLYIAQAPADFIRQFTGNISGFAGEYTHRARFAGLRAPLEAIHREWSLRYSPAFGFSSLGSKDGRLRTSWLFAVVFATFAAMFHTALRKRPPIRVLLVAAGVVLFLMTIFEGMKFTNYLVYAVPFFAALLATAAGLLLQTHRQSSVVLGAFLLWLAVPQLATVLSQIRANPLHYEFQPVVDYLRQNSAPGDRIIAGAEFAYEFGFTGPIRDDVRLGYYSGVQPVLIVTNGWYRDWFARSADGFWSSPAVANGVVYVGSYNAALYAFNAATGSLVWSAATGYGNGITGSSPAVANGVVYVGAGESLFAFNAVTGSLLWSAATQSYVASSPAVANGVVYVGSGDGNLYAFNAATGSPVWSAATGGAILDSPAVANGVVYVGSDHKLYAFNAATGTFLWRAATGSFIESSPAVANGVVYVGSDDHNLYAFALPPPAAAAFAPPARPEPAMLRPDLTLTVQP